MEFNLKFEKNGLYIHTFRRGNGCLEFSQGGSSWIWSFATSRANTRTNFIRSGKVLMLQTGQLLRHDRSCATTLVRRMELEENNYNRMRYSLETEQLYTTSCGNCLHARARSKMDSTSKCERFESKARWERKLLDYSISKIVRLLLSLWKRVEFSIMNVCIIICSWSFFQLL